MKVVRKSAEYREMLVICRINNRGRRAYGEKGCFAHFVWNLYHPEDPILEGEVIHHIDGDKLNDHPDNLQKMPDSEHKSFHMMGNTNCVGRKLSEESKRKMSIAKSGVNNPMYGKKFSKESRKKISLGMRRRNDTKFR